jgi:hypothetical protein
MPIVCHSLAEISPERQQSVTLWWSNRNAGRLPGSHREISNRAVAMLIKAIMFFPSEDFALTDRYWDTVQKKNSTTRKDS